MDDYAFFGQAFHWPPSEINNLTWKQRKALKQAYNDHVVNKVDG